MDFEKLSAPSLKELFVSQIHKMILCGKLQIGDKLPSERQLSETMQVSRSVINNGIVELERQGFVEIKPRIGAFIADYRRKGNFETLLAIMQFNGGTLGNNEIRSILELRISLDSMSIRDCIQTISTEDINHLLAIVNRIKTASHVNEASLAAFEFQHELALLSTNTLIPLIMQSFQAPIITLWNRFCSLYGIDTLYRNTYTLWQHISAHDTDAAIAWIEQSVHASIDGDRPIYY